MGRSRSGEDLDAILDAIEALVRDNVARHGLHVQSTWGEDGLAFSYTVGNHLAGHPEMIVSLVAPATAMAILNECRRRMDAGWRPTPGRHARIFTHEIEILECRDWVSRERTLMVPDFVGTEAFRLVQVVIPDERGRFAGEDGCDPAYARQERFDRERGPSGRN